MSSLVEAILRHKPNAQNLVPCSWKFYGFNNTTVRETEIRTASGYAYNLENTTNVNGFELLEYFKYYINPDVAKVDQRATVQDLFRKSRLLFIFRVSGSGASTTLITLCRINKVNLFVVTSGVNASEVDEIYRQAREQMPCVIYFSDINDSFSYARVKTSSALLKNINAVAESNVWTAFSSSRTIDELHPGIMAKFIHSSGALVYMESYIDSQQLREKFIRAKFSQYTKGIQNISQTVFTKLTRVCEYGTPREICNFIRDIIAKIAIAFSNQKNAVNTLSYEKFITTQVLIWQIDNADLLVRNVESGAKTVALWTEPGKERHVHYKFVLDDMIKKRFAAIHFRAPKLTQPEIPVNARPPPRDPMPLESPALNVNLFAEVTTSRPAASTQSNGVDALKRIAPPVRKGPSFSGTLPLAANSSRTAARIREIEAAQKAEADEKTRILEEREALRASERERRINTPRTPVEEHSEFTGFIVHSGNGGPVAVFQDVVSSENLLAVELNNHRNKYTTPLRSELQDYAAAFAEDVSHESDALDEAPTIPETVIVVEEALPLQETVNAVEEVPPLQETVNAVEEVPPLQKTVNAVSSVPTATTTTTTIATIITAATADEPSAQTEAPASVVRKPKRRNEACLASDLNGEFYAREGKRRRQSVRCAEKARVETPLGIRPNGVSLASIADIFF